MIDFLKKKLVVVGLVCVSLVSVSGVLSLKNKDRMGNKSPFLLKSEKFLKNGFHEMACFLFEEMKKKRGELFCDCSSAT